MSPRLLIALISGVIMSLTALTSRAATIPAAERDSIDNESFWTVYLAVDDVNKAIETVGGLWINAEDLAKEGRPDSDFDGFILRHINTLMVNKKATLDKFIRQAKIIYTPSFGEMTQEECLKIPYRDIICMMLCEGQMRIATRDNIDPTTNPSSYIASFLEVVGKVKEAVDQHNGSNGSCSGSCKK